MNRYEAGFYAVTATPGFKAGLRERLKSERDARPTTAPTQSFSMSKRRKALLVLIAAVLLLLSACAAAAVYWSSTQRAKAYVASEEAADDRRALAERYADEAIEGTSFYEPIAGTGEADGLSITL